MQALLLIVLSSVLSLTQASILEERALYAAGGWGLLISDPTEQCPPGTVGHDDADTVTVCCPPNFVSLDTEDVGARLCCPPGTDCSALFETSPTCVDPSWILWNHSLEGNSSYFCCLPGQIAAQTDNLLACTNGTIPDGYTSALSAVQIAPTGAAAATITGVASVTTGSVGSGSTTTKGGGILSSIISSATSHSMSTRVEPKSFNSPLLGFVGSALIYVALLLGAFTLMLGA